MLSNLHILCTTRATAVPRTALDSIRERGRKRSRAQVEYMVTVAFRLSGTGSQSQLVASLLLTFTVYILHLLWRAQHSDDQNFKERNFQAENIQDVHL